VLEAIQLFCQYYTDRLTGVLNVKILVKKSSFVIETVLFWNPFDLHSFRPLSAEKSRWVCQDDLALAAGILPVDWVDSKGNVARPEKAFVKGLPMSATEGEVVMDNVNRVF
jgi:hypothetical protein